MNSDIAIYMYELIAHLVWTNCKHNIILLVQSIFKLGTTKLNHSFNVLVQSKLILVQSNFLTSIILLVQSIFKLGTTNPYRLSFYLVTSNI